ncbi:neurofilament medium polypeptide-like [Rosa chinensis]|uniref:neurofilament medium polypeptide-like n=1 Tax=Rosa chinensis TaxID=74649 RepID=UPI001AD8B870|nr:neurofilament medium polypeptide-like [Rosa chinensis]
MAEHRDRTPQYRASLQSFNEKMKTYKGMISPDVMLRLNRTPFWEIIFVFYHGLLKDNECRKVDEDIHRMVKTYDVSQKGFLLGERIHKITREDVAICLGMRLEGVTFELNKHHQKPTKNRMIDKYFGGAKKVTKAMIDSALAESLKDPKNQVPSEVASLIVMNLFVSFLFCTSGSTLSWKLVEIGTEWNSWRRYSWATLVLDHLHNGLSKKQEDKDVNLSGCLPLIMYWLAEKTKMGGAIKRNELGSPNFIRWSLIELHKEMEKLTNEQIEEMFDRKLTEEDLEVAMHDIRGRNRGVASEESNEELREEDFVTPTFGEWHQKTNQERRKEEAESQKRMKDLIGSLEEATTQMSLSQEENQKTQDLLKKLTEENEKLARQNDRYWEMLDKAFEEDNIATRKIHILQNKLLKKWKVFTTIEKEKKNLEDVIEQQREIIHNLENELLEMERKLLEKDMLDSQEDLRKDDIENSNSDGEDGEEEGGEGADGEDGEEEGGEGADGEDGEEGEEGADGEDGEEEGGEGVNGEDGGDDDEEPEVRTTRTKHTSIRKDKEGRSSQKQEAKKQSRRRERVKKAAAEEEAADEEEPEKEPIKKMKKGKKQAVKRNSMVDRIKNKKRKATEDKEFMYTTKRTRSGKRH